MAVQTPSTFLFPLSRLPRMSTVDVLEALERLDTIFRNDKECGTGTVATISTPGFQIDDTPSSRLKVTEGVEEAFIDSGYASAEEDAEDCEGEGEGQQGSGDADLLSRIRNDAFEKDHTIRWLMGFIARSVDWSCPLSPPLSEEEVGEREDVVDKAALLLSYFSGSDDEEAEVALTRRFEFEVGTGKGAEIPSGRWKGAEGKTVIVELNDEPLSAMDHSSVGLQSWACAVVLAKLMCAEPSRFGLNAGCKVGLKHRQRILELGAGTGLLSIAAAKLLEGASFCGGSGFTEDNVSIIATDFHVDVLRNLRRNVATNFPREDGLEDGDLNMQKYPVLVTPYDWQYPSTEDPFDEPFDVIQAADVVYDDAHAMWIKSCAERLLRRPSPDHPEGGVFWLIMAVRTTGRHEGMGRSVLEAFPLHSEELLVPEPLCLKIVQVQEIEKSKGLGRADESMYKLFKICWV